MANSRATATLVYRAKPFRIIKQCNGDLRIEEYTQNDLGEDIWINKQVITKQDKFIHRLLLHVSNTWNSAPGAYK